MSILEIKNITKKFGGVHAVDHLSLRFEAGRITGIIGPNGSGKSTLVNVLTGMIPSDGGAVAVSDTTLFRVEPEEVSVYGITRTFQDVRLFEQMSVLDNILVVLTERSVWGAMFEKHGKFHLEKAEEVLKQVGLWEKRHELAHDLSYGQRKLLEIARALGMTRGSGSEGEIFFFDEPFAGLFPEMIKVVMAVLEDLRKKGKAVILIEHNMEIIRKMCDYLYVLDSGKLLAEGIPDKVLSKSEVMEAYLGE